MKVLYIYNYAERSGAAYSLILLMEELKKLGVTPIVACPPGKAMELFRQRNFDVRVGVSLPFLFSGTGVPLRGARLLAFILSLRDFVRVPAFRRMVTEIQPDLVHFNERSLIFAAKQVKRLGIPVVMHARNVACQETRWALWMCESYIEKYVDHVIAIDESVRRSLPRVSKSSVVYNSLESTEPSTSPKLIDPAEKKILLYLGNLLYAKGVWDLLEAVRILRHRTDFQLFIVGGNTRPPEFFKTLKGRIAKFLGVVKEGDRLVLEFISKHGLESHVVYKGYVEDVNSLIERTYVNIFPSHADGPSRSVFEAGIAGVPSILTLINKVEDVVKDGVNGLIVPPKNPTALAAAIVRLLDCPALRNQLGQNAQQQYKTQCAVGTAAAEVMKIYQHVLNSSKPTR